MAGMSASEDEETKLWEEEVKRPMKSGKKRRERGIFGIPKPKKRIFFNPNDDKEWSSDDSDEDFSPEVNERVKDVESSRYSADDDNDDRKKKLRRVKPKIARIESDDDNDDDDGPRGKDDDSSFRASDVDDSDGGGKERGSVGGRGKVRRKSYVEESDDSDEECPR